MIKKIFDRITTRTRLGFFAVMLLLFISYILTFISTRKVSVQDFWKEHTNEVIHNLDNILGFISDGESSFRGYLLTNDKALLVKYGVSKKRTDSTFSKLKVLTIQNESQKENLDILHKLIQEKYHFQSAFRAKYHRIQFNGK
jgi:CHASE3 domain sensor protein